MRKSSCGTACALCCRSGEELPLARASSSLALYVRARTVRFILLVDSLSLALSFLSICSARQLNARIYTYIRKRVQPSNCLKSPFVRAAAAGASRGVGDPFGV